MSQLVKTKRQGNFKDFKLFGAFKKLGKQKKTLYSTRSLKKLLYIHFKNHKIIILILSA
jgi:hypothetical protein